MHIQRDKITLSPACRAQNISTFGTARASLAILYVDLEGFDVRQTKCCSAYHDHFTSETSATLKTTFITLRRKEMPTSNFNRNDDIDWLHKKPKNVQRAEILRVCAQEIKNQKSIEAAQKQYHICLGIAF